MVSEQRHQKRRPTVALLDLTREPAQENHHIALKRASSLALKRLERPPDEKTETQDHHQTLILFCYNL